MSSYISSNANRFYTALESAYGRVESITATNRIPAVKLGIRQQVETGTRRDKTGSRTFAGVPAGVRRRTTFDLQTYLTSWDKTAAGPGYGPLFEAAMGGSPVRFGGGTVASSTQAGRLGFGAPHGLAPGQAVCVGRRDPVRGGDCRCADSAVECAVSGVARGGSGNHGDGDVCSGDGTEEREHLRLLESGDGGAEAASRGGSGPDGDPGEWGLPRIPFQRDREGPAGQRELRGRRGAVAELSGGATGGRVRLLDCAGAHGAGVVGDGAFAVLHDHGGDDRSEE